MLRRCVSAAALLLVIGGFVLADVTGVVTKVELKDGKGKITVKTGKKGESKEVVVTVTKDTTFATRGKKGGEPKDSTVADFEKAVEKAGDKGKVFAKIETTGDDASPVAKKVIYGGGRGKKKAE